MNTIKALLVALKDRNIPESSPEYTRLLDIQTVAKDIFEGSNLAWCVTCITIRISYFCWQAESGFRYPLC